MALGNVGNFPLTPNAHLVKTGAAAVTNIPLVVTSDASFVEAGFSSSEGTGGTNITASANLTQLLRNDFGSVQGFFGYDAEVLRTAGYRTAMAGKWHLTKAVNPENDAAFTNLRAQGGFLVTRRAESRPGCKTGNRLDRRRKTASVESVDRQACRTRNQSQ